VKPYRLSNQFGDLLAAKARRPQRSTTGDGKVWQLVGGFQPPPKGGIESGQQPIVHRE
jgi:hypothetical protein